MNNGIVQVATLWCLCVIGVSSFSTLHFGLRQSLVGSLQIQSGTPSLEKAVPRTIDPVIGRRWGQYSSSASSLSGVSLGTRLSLAVSSPPSEDDSANVSEETPPSSTLDVDPATSGTLGTEKYLPRNPPKDFKRPDQVEAQKPRIPPKDFIPADQVGARKPRVPPNDFIPADQVGARKPRVPPRDFIPADQVGARKPRVPPKDFIPADQVGARKPRVPPKDFIPADHVGARKPRIPPKDFIPADQVGARKPRVPPKDFIPADHVGARKPRIPPKDFIPPDKVDPSQFKPRYLRSDLKPKVPSSTTRTSNAPRNARSDFVPRSAVTNETVVSLPYRGAANTTQKQAFSRQKSKPMPPRGGWIPYNRSLVVSGGNFTDLPKDERKELADLKYGTIVQGWVAKISENGIHVDVGAKKNPMVFSSQLPPDVRANLTLGQDIEVRLISYEPEKNRARLGFIQSQQTALDKTARKEPSTYALGSVVKGVVITIIPAGAFVDVGSTRNAYLPSSRVPDDVGVLKSGQEVEVRITSYDPQRDQLHLGLIVDGVDHSGFQEAAFHLVNHGWNESSFVAAKVVDVSDTRTIIEVNATDLNNETEGILTGNLSALQIDRDQVSRHNARVGDTIDVRLARILNFVPMFTTHNISRTPPPSAKYQPRKPRSDFESGRTTMPKSNIKSIKAWIQRTPGWKPYPREALSDGKYKEEEDIERKELSDFKIGSVVKGWVAKITDFGAFVDIGAQTNILVHISHIATNFVDNIHDYLTLGQDVDVRLLKYDPEKQQIRASLMDGNDEPSSKRQDSAFIDHQKAVLQDLWFHEWDKEKVVEGRVISTTNFGAFVRVESSEIMDVCSGSFHGLIPISTIGEGHIANVSDYLNVNDVIRVRLTRIFDHKATLQWVKNDGEIPEQRSIRYYNSQEPDIGERAQFKYEFTVDDDGDAESYQYVDVNNDEVDMPTGTGIIRKKSRTRRNKKFKALEELYEMVLDRYGHIPDEESEDEDPLADEESNTFPDDRTDEMNSHEIEMEYSPVQPDDDDDNLEEEDDQTEDNDMEGYDEDEDQDDDDQDDEEQGDDDQNQVDQGEDGEEPGHDDDQDEALGQNEDHDEEDQIEAPAQDEDVQEQGHDGDHGEDHDNEEDQTEARAQGEDDQEQGHDDDQDEAPGQDEDTGGKAEEDEDQDNGDQDDEDLDDDDQDEAPGQDEDRDDDENQNEAPAQSEDNQEQGHNGDQDEAPGQDEDRNDDENQNEAPAQSEDNQDQGHDDDQDEAPGQDEAAEDRAEEDDSERILDEGDDD